MRVAVLCGGKGTRLGEPIKCLAEVAGRPFMDYKLEQLERCGATSFVLICGPYGEPFIKRYGDRCVYWADPQTGIRDAIQPMPDDIWWTWGDSLCEVNLWLPPRSTMLVRRDEKPNIAGIYLDVGLYFGKSEHQLVETTAPVHHINTREDLEKCDAFLARQVRDPRGRMLAMDGCTP